MDFSKIVSALSKTTESSYEKERAEYFSLTKDKAGNASAVIRFLPMVEGDDLPFVKMYTHAFKGPTGKWYIENCRSTIGETDPVNEGNAILWAGTDKDKDVARQRKRKTKYISNVYVVSDPSNRENEGKVLKFSYGQKIFDMIKNKMDPQFEDEKPVNVFDLYEGANFKLRMRQVEGYPNYDQSVFGDVGPIADSDEAILKIMNSAEPLSPLVAPDKFKSYDDLKKKFESVINPTGAVPARASVTDDDEPVKESKPTKVVEQKQPKVSKTESTEESEEDLEEYFKSIS